MYDKFKKSQFKFANKTFSSTIQISIELEKKLEIHVPLMY